MDPCHLRVFGEIEHCQQFLSLAVPADSQHLVVARIQDPNVRVAVKGRMLRPDLLLLHNSSKDRAFRCILCGPPLGLFPVHIAPVQIPAVVSLHRIVMISIVVFLRDLISAVDHRNPAEGKHQRMKHHIQPDGFRHRLLPAFLPGGFNPAQGSCRTAQPGVPQSGIIVIQFTP